MSAGVKAKMIKMWGWIAVLIIILTTLGTADPSRAQQKVPPIVGPLTSQALKSQEVMETVKRVADWQMAHPELFDPLNWAIAPLYNGLIAVSKATGDPKYLAAVLRAGERVGWRAGPKKYLADDQAVGSAWLKIYFMDRTKTERLTPFKNRMDEVLANPITDNLLVTTSSRSIGAEPSDRWTWSDALYMAPPTLGLLAQITNDERYLKFIDAEYKLTYDALYDRQDKLFYRDTRFIDQRTPDGQKVFWSRGNGWVYAGLADLLEVMPVNYPTRQFYVELFKEISSAIVAAQQPDGLWYPSLKDPGQIPIGETSGSALFIYGLAWGVQGGTLSRAIYWPVVERGWNGLLTRIGATGTVYFVQPPSTKPEGFDADSQAPYGSGAVLGAGSEILKALAADAKVDPVTLLSKAESLVHSAPDLSEMETRLRSQTNGAWRARDNLNSAP